jgi:uncharacterized protein YjcR
MPKRSEMRDAAKAEYVALRSRGEDVNLRELSERLGVNYKTLRDWKGKDQWEQAVPPKKRGGQPGNQNSKGHKNAAGHHKGAPVGNRNAEKDGAYSTIFFDALTDDERDLMDRTPLGSREALEHEMKILKFRENKILCKIAEYEQAPEEALYVHGVMLMEGKEDMTMTNKDSAFARVLKLQEALYKVQGRIAKIADSLRAMEDQAQRLELERARLEIMRMRCTGVVDSDLDDPGDLPDLEREDVKDNS